ncbi:MAG: T9SS type A sorting domain-containing protein [Bacteroidia bacterium]|nr:T9SS type A sorting domain-containing protein [Bacteroidia bacterium]
MKRSLLVLAFVMGMMFSRGQVMVVDTFYFTGSPEQFTVPACVDTLYISAWGAQGQNALIGGTGGLGGYAFGDKTVNPGDVVYVRVGGQNGYNGGGRAGLNGNNAFSMPPQGDSAGCGGGASDVRINGVALPDRVIVAGGGGGAGHNGVWPACQTSGPGGNGGAGGGTTGGIGTDGVGTPCNCGGGGGALGQAGTPTAGGAAGAYAGSTACLRSSWTIGNPGVLGDGGAGSTSFHNGSGGGGGGGGGYYGGGSGGQGSDTTPGGGGGGGSSFTGTLSNAGTTQGQRNGNGIVIIRYFNPCAQGVDEIMSQISLHAYPNPAGASINVSITGLQIDGTVIVRDVLGNILGSYQLNKGTTQIEISTVEFSSGLYSVEFNTTYGSVTRKFLKQ